MSLRSKLTRDHSTSKASSVKRNPTYVKTASVNAAATASGEAGARSRDGVPLGGPSAGYDRRKSRVGEKMKKRLSMRYADSPNPASPAPPLPIPSTVPREMRRAYDDAASSNPVFSDLAAYDLPGPSRGRGLNTTKDEEYVRPRNSVVPGMLLARADGRRREDTSASGSLDSGKRGKGWDLDGLKGDDFEVNGYVKQTLAGAEDDEVAAFKEALMNRKGQNATELKQNVFKNYAEFVTISKEIATLENDMLELKDLLVEWKAVPQLLGVDVDAAADGDASKGSVLSSAAEKDRRRTARSSLLDLQNLYRSQLQTLWTTISGSQKFLPLVPGRHLVHEARSFVELNNATYRVKQAVELFLLNDLLLVATRRSKGGGGGDVGGRQGDEVRGKLVAERAWTYNEIVVVDAKDSGDLTNAIKIRRGKETFVYRTSRSEEKKALLGAFRQVAEELAAKKRKENEKEQERRKSMWTGDMWAHLGGADAPPMPTLTANPFAATTVDIGRTDSSFVDSFEDDLTMAIATKSWNEAVELVGKGKEHLGSAGAKAVADSSLTMRLAKLAKRLATELAYDLSDPNIRKSQVIRLVGLLATLEEHELARDTFLAAREDLLKKRVRSIGLEGDIYVYINELGLVTFTLLKHTSEWYTASFKENRMASGLSEWLERQVEHFADTFRRQAYGPIVDGATVDDCLRITAAHNRKLLREAGHDFAFLLSTLLQPDHDDPHVQPNAVFVGASASASASAAARSVSSPRSAMSDGRSAMPPVSLAAALPAPIPTPAAAAAGYPVAPSGPAPSSPRPPPRSERRARPAPRTPQMSGEARF